MDKINMDLTQCHCRKCEEKRSAISAPLEGIRVDADPIEVEIDKEWIKDLLAEFSKPLIMSDEMYDNGGWLQYIDEFLEKSEVWNGR